MTEGAPAGRTNEFFDIDQVELARWLEMPGGGEARFSTDITVPGFQEAVRLERALKVGVNGTVEDVKIHLHRAGHANPMALFWVKLETGPDGAPVSWNPWHREVIHIERGQGLIGICGRYAERLIRQIHAHNPDTPLLMEMSSARPSVVEHVGLKNGFVIREEDQEVWERYEKEAATHPGWEDRGELPSFLLMLTTNAKAPVLLDRKKLTLLEEQTDPSERRYEIRTTERGMQVLSEPEDPTADPKKIRLPKVRIHLSKQLDPL